MEERGGEGRAAGGLRAWTRGAGAGERRTDPFIPSSSGALLLEEEEEGAGVGWWGTGRGGWLTVRGERTAFPRQRGRSMRPMPPPVGPSVSGEGGGSTTGRWPWARHQLEI